ncbi:PepSY-associated TM helix domain-containing protein [Gemmatimonas aurantiaca]|uniref:PepSY-associated TM helix domain-containing protein n=1 Tax=Gemmatimonas aurantiaca TaxID=173480 RepID=UPI00301E5191
MTARSLSMIRSVFFWTHLVMGITGGIIIFIMSLTGVLLGFERQLIASLDGAPVATVPSAQATRLDVDQLLARSGASADPIASIAIKAGAQEPVTIRFRDRERPSLLVNPYTADVIPPVTGGKTAAFMSWLRGWHRWLGVTGESRPLARAITGACNAAFLLLVLTGFVIWLPRRLSAAAFRTAAIFNVRLAGKARDFNWHNSLGIWSALPLAAVVATAMFISYQWPGRLLDKYFGNPRERAAATAIPSTPGTANTSRPSGEAGEPRPGNSLVPLAGMMQTVTMTRPEWQSITITIPPRPDSALQFAVAEGNTYRPDLRHQYFFDASTAQLLRTSNYDSLSTSRKIRAWYRFGHTGEVFGVTGQLIATLVSFVGVVLVYTGFALSWRRLAAFLRRRRRGIA